MLPTSRDSQRLYEVTDCRHQQEFFQKHFRIKDSDVCRPSDHGVGGGAWKGMDNVVSGYKNYDSNFKILLNFRS